MAMGLGSIGTKLEKGDRIVLKEEVQLLRGREEWEPPYGIMLLTKKNVVLGSEGKEEVIPLEKIKGLECEEVGGTYQRLFGKKYIKVKYRRGKKLVSAPLFACAHGLFGALLGSSRDKRTQHMRDVIEAHMQRCCAPKKRRGRRHEKPADIPGLL